MMEAKIRDAYVIAKEQYADAGIDTDDARPGLARIVARGLNPASGELSPGGFEAADVIALHPGKARTISELRADIEKALSLIPGKHRLNLHACYLDHGGKRVDRFRSIRS